MPLKIVARMFTHFFLFIPVYKSFYCYKLVCVILDGSVEYFLLQPL